MAYSFQRGLLQGGGWSPQWLYTEAFFGTGIYDVAELVDDDAAPWTMTPRALQAADPETLMAACEQVTSAIVADDAAGTVTFNLAQPWAPLLATMAGSWGSIIDKDWAIEHGAWDGDCATWQNYYGITSENTPPPRSSPTAPVPTCWITGPPAKRLCWSPTRTTGATEPPMRAALRPAGLERVVRPER